MAYLASTAKIQGLESFFLFDSHLIDGFLAYCLNIVENLEMLIKSKSGGLAIWPTMQELH